MLAILATGSSVLAAAGQTWRTQWERLRVRFAGDVDVVVGLEPETIQLVRALVREASEWTRWEPWHKRFPLRNGDLRRMLANRPTVVVVSSKADEPLLTPARLEGARVYIADLANEQAMARLLLRPAWRSAGVSLRRLYLLGQDQSENLKLHDCAERVLGRPTLGPHAKDVVPRIVVRMEDSREAREWRASHFGEEARPDDAGWFCDAVSQEEVLATQIADLVVEKGIAQVFIIGDSALAMALLDALAWRRWARYNILRAAIAAVKSSCGVGSDRESQLVEAWRRLSDDQPIDRLGDSAWPHPEERTPIRLRGITLVCPTANEMCGEWTRTRAPWGSPDLEPLDVRPKQSMASQVENVLGELIRNDGSGLIVVAEANPTCIVGARREARRDDETTILVPDATTHGVAEPVVSGGIGRYGPTWLMAGEALEDSWTALGGWC